MHSNIIAIIDESGSMSVIASEAVHGFNQFLDDQRALPGTCSVSLYKFAYHPNAVYTKTDIDVAPKLALGLNYRPTGGTALLDAIGTAINRHPEGGNIFVILTDGEENASKAFNRSSIKEMVQSAEQRGCKFVFLAANQDAFLTADNLGINREYVHNFAYSGAGTTEAYRSISASVTQIRGVTF